MLHYILVRHGESTANVDETVRETIEECDIPLTQKGITQSVAAAKTIYSHKLNEASVTVLLSPYLRAKQTFEHIKDNLPCDISKIVEDVRLRELDYGSNHARKGEAQDECKRQIAKKGSLFYYQYTDGESYTSLLTRLSTLNNELLGDWREREYPHQVVLMIAHAHVLAAFDILLLKKNIKRLNYKMPNCEIRHYVKEKGKDFKRNL